MDAPLVHVAAIFAWGETGRDRFSFVALSTRQGQGIFNWHLELAGLYNQ